MVIEAEHAQKASLFFQHADDLEGLVLDFDPVAKGRLVAEQIGRHLGADDAHRPAARGIRGGNETALRNADAAGEQVFLGGAEDRHTAGAAVLVFHGPVVVRGGRDGGGERQLPGQRLGFRKPDRAALPLP